jgi:hypothetical protein
MPSCDQHLAHAKSNLEFLNSFLHTYTKNDWAITVAFYTAVHLIEYSIAKEQKFTFYGGVLEIQHSDQLPYKAEESGINPPEGINKENLSPHKARNLLLKGCPVYAEICDTYQLLFKQCHTARYRMYVWEDFKIKLIISQYFNPILAWFNKKYSVGMQEIKI